MRNKSVLVILVALLCSGILLGVPLNLASEAFDVIRFSACPMYGHDNMHTGQSPLSGPQTTPVTKWVFEVPDSAGDRVMSPPVIDSDGTIYVCAMKNLYAINPDGTTKWTFPIYWGSTYGIAVADGAIYLIHTEQTTANGAVSAINPDGSQKWIITFPNRIPRTAVVLGRDGTIYTLFSVDTSPFDGILYAIAPDGALRWETSLLGYSPYNSTPAISSNGNIYLGGAQLFHVFNSPDGNGLAAIPVSNAGSPAIGPDGTIYTCTGKFTLLALNPGDLARKWSFEAESSEEATPSPMPAIGSDGIIYVACHGLYAIGADGTKKWTAAAGEFFLSPPAIGVDGTVYVGSESGRVFAVGPDGTVQWSVRVGFGKITGVVIGADNSLYVSSTDRRIYALASPVTPTPTPNPSPTPAPLLLHFFIGNPAYFVGTSPKQMDTAPVIVESRTFLPIRYVAQELGFNVDWLAGEQKVTISSPGFTLQLWIGKNTAMVAGKYTVIDASNPNVMPFIQPPGRTMMPLRFIAENLGCQVDWLPETKEVQITYPAP
ncbi:MAG: stalk domain-containing protein [Coprothermobacterota bacterium]|nr:stalk domain-containing protein [Coprothermobacterota bacterium]